MLTAGILFCKLPLRLPSIRGSIFYISNYVRSLVMGALIRSASTYY